MLSTLCADDQAQEQCCLEEEKIVLLASSAEKLAKSRSSPSHDDVVCVKFC